MSHRNTPKANKKGISDDGADFLISFNKDGDCSNMVDQFEEYFSDATGRLVGNKTSDGVEEREYIAEKIVKGSLFYSRKTIEERRIKWEGDNETRNGSPKFLYQDTYEDRNFGELCEDFNEDIELLKRLMTDRRQILKDEKADILISKIDNWLTDWKKRGRKDALVRDIMKAEEEVEEAVKGIGEAHTKFFKRLAEKEKERLEKEVSKLKAKFQKEYPHISYRDEKRNMTGEEPGTHSDVSSGSDSDSENDERPPLGRSTSAEYREQIESIEKESKKKRKQVQKDYHKLSKKSRTGSPRK
jgi:hypothetical protein